MWGSKAADAGTPQRDARFFMSRALNKLDTGRLPASMLLGHDASGSSETFVYVDMWAALRSAKAKAGAAEAALDEEEAEVAAEDQAVENAERAMCSAMCA